MNKKILGLVLSVSMLCTAAQAATFSGTVEPTRTVEVYAPIGGTVAMVQVAEGQYIDMDTPIADLAVTNIYASEAGTITGIFGQPGDNGDTVSQKYGAVMYIEGETVYTISASTTDAYNSTENKFVSVGEEVYLSCYSDGSHTGTGIITSIEGTSFDVEVTSGTFMVSETVNVFRGMSANSKKRIGRGTLNRKNPTAVTANGAIVSIEVNDGDTVEKGQILMTTLNGSYDGYVMTGTQIKSPVQGTVALLKVSQGGNVEKGSVAAVIYPAGEMRVEAQISEYDLGSVAVGDKVQVELLWNQDSGVSYEGTISMISAIATESASSSMGTGDSSAEATYTVYVDFTPDEYTRFGMQAVVSTLDETESATETPISE